MVELLHKVRVYEHQLCRHCNHTFHVPVCVPPAGADSSALRFGHELKAEDVALITESAASTQTYLADIELEIETLQSTLQWAQKARAELKQLHDLQQAYLAPVRKLPTDVLSNIFEHCCADEIDLNGWTCPPIDLSAVCKLWRETIHSMPVIWARFWLRSTDSFPLGPGRLAARLQVFLKHSRDLPLKHRVYYVARPMDDVEGEEQLAPLNLLLQHTYRWTALRVRRFSRYPPYDFARALQRRPFPRLTSLEGRASDLRKIDGLFMIPTLRCLKLIQGFPPDAIPAKLPFSQLTELHLRSNSGYALSILQLCPNIEVVHHVLVFGYHEDEGPVPSAVVVLPCLRLLGMTLDMPYDLGLLDGLDAPALQILSMKWSGQLMSQQASSHVGAFVARSACRLRELRLDFAPLVEQECISSLVDLTTLVLSSGASCPPIRPGLLEELKFQDGTGAPRMLPHLQNLRLGHVVMFTATELAEVVRVRRLMGYPLRVITFHNGQYGEADSACYE